MNNEVCPLCMPGVPLGRARKCRLSLNAPGEMEEIMQPCFLCRRDSIQWLTPLTLFKHVQDAFIKGFRPQIHELKHAPFVVFLLCIFDPFLCRVSVSWFSLLVCVKLTRREFEVQLLNNSVRISVFESWQIQCQKPFKLIIFCMPQVMYLFSSCYNNGRKCDIRHGHHWALLMHDWKVFWFALVIAGLFPVCTIGCHRVREGF